MKKIVCLICCLIAVSYGIASAAGDTPAGNNLTAAEQSASKAEEKPADSVFFDPAYMAGKPPIEKIGDGVYKFGTLTMNRTENYLDLPVEVNMDKGLLEYILVGRAGKVHESLLRTDVDAQVLQTALLFLDLKGSSKPLAEQGDSQTPQGDRVELWILPKADKLTPVRVEEWVVNKEQDQALESMEWVFTGSFFNQDNMFMAQVHHSLIALYHDPAALIDHKQPEGSRDDIWFVKEGTVPSAGTSATLRIKKVVNPQ